jgi:hypothetical protein
VAEPARSGVNEHRHLIVGESVAVRGRPVKDPCHPLQLDEVVARAHRPELAGAALAGALGDGGGIGAGQAAPRLRALEIVCAGVKRPRPLAQDPVELLAVTSAAASLAGAGRDRAREFVDERLTAPA